MDRDDNVSPKHNANLAVITQHKFKLELAFCLPNALTSQYIMGCIQMI